MKRGDFSAGEARVLVSVPTSSTGVLDAPCSRLTDRHEVPASGLKGFPNELVNANLASDRASLFQHVGAFPLDRAGRRLSSLRCAVGFAARAHAVSEKGKRTDRSWMVTTTYAGEADAWRPDHWKTAIHRIRQWCNRQGFACRYVWVAELQEARAARFGRPAVIHYHAVFWLPQGVRMPKWDTRGWWPHGRCNRKPVRKSAVGYLMKYLSKGTDVASGSFPRGARVYGCGGLDHSLRRARRWLRLPAFVQGNSSILDDWQRRVGGGWISPSGQHVESEFLSTLVGGVRALVRVARHAIRMDAKGPFSWLEDRQKSLAVKH